MDEYISKTKFEELMRKKARNNFDLYYADKSKHYHDNAIGYNTAADEAYVFPSADVQPVKHGRWTWDSNAPHREYGAYKCSNCGCHSDFEENYCYNCGARMDLKEGDTE